MALLNKETGQPAPSRGSSAEQLHQLNEAKQRALENSLLKEALTEYSEKYEQLQRELRSILQTAERNYESERNRNAEKLRALQESVNQLKSANELLSSNMKDQIEALTSSVKSETVAEVKAGLKENLEQIGKATKKLEDYEKTISVSMRSSLENFKEKQDSFFEFDSIRSILFWAGCVLNIFTFFLLIYFLFFRG